MSYLIFFDGLLVGVVVTLAMQANKHHSSVRKVIEDVDDLIDKADDVVKEKWSQLRDKF